MLIPDAHFYARTQQPTPTDKAMIITQVTVHAESRFNDRHEPFRNHCPSVELCAYIDSDEDPHECLTRLQGYAADALEEERKRIFVRRNAEAEQERKTAAHRNRIERVEAWRDEIRTNVDYLAGTKDECERAFRQEDIARYRKYIAQAKQEAETDPDCELLLLDDDIDFELPEPAADADGKGESV